MQHWLMSEGFPAQLYNWSFNRKEKWGRGEREEEKRKKNSYKLVSSQDGSFMFFRTFLTSFSKSLRALCSSSNDFFIFLLSCLTEQKYYWFGFGWFLTAVFWPHIHCQLQILKALLRKTAISCSKAEPSIKISQVTQSYFTQHN